VQRSGWISRQGESSYSSSPSSERGAGGGTTATTEWGILSPPVGEGGGGVDLGAATVMGGGVGALLELDFLLLAPKSRVGGGIGGLLELLLHTLVASVYLSLDYLHFRSILCFIIIIG
jgi:hypothetical protein